MRALVQKIHRCTLSVDDQIVSKVGYGLLVTVGVNRFDTMEDVKYVAHKIANMRMFKGENDKLTKNLYDVNGEILVVSNFTLQAEIRSGTRPNFSHAMEPEKANELYLALAQEFRNLGVKNVEIGSFRHHMHLDTILDGPFNIIIDTNKTGE